LTLLDVQLNVQFSTNRVMDGLVKAHIGNLDPRKHIVKPGRRP